MSDLKIRKISVISEDTVRMAGRLVTQPSRKVLAAAVLENRFVGQFVDDLSSLHLEGEEVAGLLVQRALAALSVKVENVTSYGKGAIIGVGGELEHGAALIHPLFGGAVRAALGGGKAIMCSNNKLGGPGALLTIPLANKNEIWDFDDMDSIDLMIPDAPHANEIVIAVALGVGGRPLHRTPPRSLPA